MRAWELQGGFGVEHLGIVERTRTDVPDRHVRLRMHAASLNYRDLLMVDGKYNPKLALPLVPCSDGAGEVILLGSGVERVRPGDRVMPIFGQGWYAGPPDRDLIRNRTLGGPLDGTLAQEMTVHEDDLVIVPANLSFMQAATLPCAGVTAWNALVTEGYLRSTDTVLVQGSGGVSVFALQIAKTLGARVIATTSSDEKAAHLTALGADHVINYRNEKEWGKVARDWAGKDGVDHVVDVGGASTLAESIRAVRPGGTITLIGVLGGASEKLELRPIFMNRVRIQGIFVGNRTSFEAMNEFIERTKLEPIVDRVFPFDDAVRAFEHLRSGAHLGKVVIGITT